MVVLFTVQNPRHFKDEDVVEHVWIVIFEDVDHVLDELHVHVLEAAAGAVEHKRHLAATGRPIDPVNPGNVV